MNDQAKKKTKNYLTGKNYAIGIFVGIILFFVLMWAEHNFAFSVFNDWKLIVLAIGGGLAFSLVIVPFFLQSLSTPEDQPKKSNILWRKRLIISAVFFVVAVAVNILSDFWAGYEMDWQTILSDIVFALFISWF